MFNKEKYLKLLGVDVSVPSLQFLKKLQLQHLYTFPFENLDIHLKQPIVLNIDKIAAKIIDQGRGGFCYELNGLFFELLKSLSFKCYLISAEVWSDGKWGPPYDHMGIVVVLDDIRYLVDVGFGDCFIYPKKIDDEAWQIDGNVYYRLRKEYDTFYLERSTDMLNAEPQYRFAADPRQFIEFIAMCDYQQYDPNSHFLKKKVVSKLTKTGRITLNNDKLTITEKGIKSTQEVHSIEEFNILLKEHFGYSFT